MKFILLAFFSFTLYAAKAPPQPRIIIDYIKSMTWDGEKYTIKFDSYLKELTVSGNHPQTPCLENAVKAHMGVMLKVDEAEPAIMDCNLWSNLGPVQYRLDDSRKPRVQAQEEKLPK